MRTVVVATLIIYRPILKRGDQMDVTSYCDTLEKQLVGWKAKIYDVIQMVDKLPANEKEDLFPSIRSLHSMVEEINGELQQLKTACPADWSPSRNTIDDKMSELRITLKNLSEKVGGPLIPDSLSWVSE
jgi:hypothetical protein